MHTYQDVQQYSGTNIHPKILELIFNLQNDAFERSNQICIATMFALRDFLNDHQIGDGAADGPANTVSGSRKEDPLSYSERLKLQEDWVAATSFVRDSKRLHEGVLNALEEADRLMQEEIEDLSLRQIQTAMSQWIEGFIENKIVYAQDEMVR